MPAKNREPERNRPELIGPGEAADRCDVSYRTIRRWISDGRLTAYRVGPRLIKIDAAELQRMLHPIGGVA